MLYRLVFVSFFTGVVFVTYLFGLFIFWKVIACFGCLFCVVTVLLFVVLCFMIEI